MATSKTAVLVNYKKAGTQPPIFVAGTFSEPSWQPQEMTYTTDLDGEHSFSSEVMVEPGKEHQFKIKVGHGEWWVLSENHPVGMQPYALEQTVNRANPPFPLTVTDEAGNKNNILAVPEAVSVGEDNQPPEQAQDAPSNSSGAASAKTSDAELLAVEATTSRPRTPVQVVANTAAEVADTAEQLDRVWKASYILISWRS